MVARNQHLYGPFPQALALATKQLVVAFTPSAITALGLIAARRRLPPASTAYLPGWVIALSAIASIPLLATIKVKHREWSERRRAAAYGASLPVQRLGKWFGSLDIIAMMFTSLNTGFLGEWKLELTHDKTEHGISAVGDFVWDEVARLGETFEFYVLWERSLITSDANIIKVSYEYY